MYQPPRTYTCDLCEHEFAWTPSEHSSVPVTSDGHPACPRCWDEFLIQKVGIATKSVAIEEPLPEKLVIFRTVFPDVPFPETEI